MLRPVAEGVQVHVSEFCQSNAVIVQGAGGVLLIDPGVQDHELACLAGDLAAAGQTVVAGFATHPHWDHLLWQPSLGDAPRYGTARCAAVAREQLPDAAAKARLATSGFIPPDIVDSVPMDLLGIIDGLPGGTGRVPWDGPAVRVVEHQAHAPGHAALLVEDSGVLVAGDMLSDIFMPMLDLASPGDPVGDYLAALRLLEEAAGDAAAVIPGHGSVGGPGQVRARITQDRAYVRALRDDAEPSDARTGPAAWQPFVPGVHQWQAQILAERREAAG